MHRLQGMSYNPATSKTTVLYQLRGCATCLGPHRRSAPSSPRTFYGKPGSRSDARRLCISPSSGTSLPCCSTRSRTCRMRWLANAWAFRGLRSDVGASGGPLGTFPWRTSQDGGVSPFFPPLDYALVKAIAWDVLPGMNAGASLYAVPSPIEGSGTAWVLLGSWALSPARPTPIHPRHECRGFSALLVSGATVP